MQTCVYDMRATDAWMNIWGLYDSKTVNCWDKVGHVKGEVAWRRNTIIQQASMGITSLEMSQEKMIEIPPFKQNISRDEA